MSNLIRSRKTRASAILATAAVSMGIMAGPAAAQQGQPNGLVNLAVVDVLNNNTVVANVQVPIGIAANICGVNVGVIQDARRQGLSPACTAEGEGDADSNTVIRQLPRPFQP